MPAGLQSNFWVDSSSKLHYYYGSVQKQGRDLPDMAHLGMQPKLHNFTWTTGQFQFPAIGALELNSSSLLNNAYTITDAIYTNTDHLEKRVEVVKQLLTCML